MKTVLLLIGFVVASIHFAEAQQTGKVPRIGFLSGRDSKTPGPYIEAFRQGLRDMGYIEGKSILVEYRYAEGKLDRVPRLLAELVQLKVDVLVAGFTVGIREAKEATKTIPIVMVATFDPVASGIIDSLARPGGNITGIATLLRELSGKRLELLKEVIPRISRVGILWDANAPGPTISFKEYEAAARVLQLPIQSLEARAPNLDFERALQAGTKARINALIAITNPVLTPYAKQIADLAIKNRLPLMCERNDYVEAGGLISYAANDAESYGRAAVYVDKILKGAKPAELPVEQPTKFELVINLKTAKQISLTIPPNVVARADKVIR
jgi:putative tryptophan/tyrosine transport system substrate-binding protein